MFHLEGTAEEAGTHFHRKSAKNLLLVARQKRERHPYLILSLFFATGNAEYFYAEQFALGFHPESRV